MYLLASTRFQGSVKKAGIHLHILIFTKIPAGFSKGVYHNI